MLNEVYLCPDWVTIKDKMTSIHYGKCEKCNCMGGLNNSLVCLCCVDEKNLLSRAIKKENQDLRTKLEASEDNVEALKEKTGQVIIEREEWKSKAFKVNWDIGGIENKLKIAVEALEHIKKHQEVKASHTDSRMFKLSAIWLMTDKALEKIKGMEG